MNDFLYYTQYTNFKKNSVVTCKLVFHDISTKTVSQILLKNYDKYLGIVNIKYYKYYSL